MDGTNAGAGSRDEVELGGGREGQFCRVGVTWWWPWRSGEVEVACVGLALLVRERVG